MVEIELDGKKVQVREGIMIMDAANLSGTYIPHFCYHKKLSIAANCRMCLVDIEKSAKPLPACATPVSQGMVVRTNSIKATSAQKDVMQFLLINHPLDCPICDQGGECQLQDLAVGYGSSESKYDEEKRVVVPKDAGPLISMKEMNRCIHCTRCVRFGQEIGGSMEFGMIGRGEHSEISSFVGKTVDSELSGNMIDICPVGALTSKPFRYSARTWELSRRKSISSHDSLGSNLIVQVKSNKILRVLPFDNEDINECWLSDRDRFSYEGINSKSRLTSPMIKENGKWKKVDWHSALNFVAKSTAEIIERSGADSLVSLAAQWSTLEEFYLIQKLMRSLGSENIDFRLRQVDFFKDENFKPWLGMKIKDINKLKDIFVVGSFLRKDHPLMSTRFRSAVKEGANFSLMHCTDDDLLIDIKNKIIVSPNEWFEKLCEIAVCVSKFKKIKLPFKFNSIKITDKSEKIAAELVNSKSKAIFLGNSVVHHAHARKIHTITQWIVQSIGSNFGYLTESANTIGGYLSNAFPNNEIDTNNFFLKNKKAFFLFNVEPEFDCTNPQLVRESLNEAELVVSFSPFINSLDLCNVLLPISTSFETPGTFINAEGRAQSFNAVIKPLEETRPGWKVLRVLANLLKLNDFDYESSEEIKREVLDIQDSKNFDLSNLLNNFTSEKIEMEPETVEYISRIGEVPIYFSDPIVRRADSLQRTIDASIPKASVSTNVAEKFSLSENDIVKVTQGNCSIKINCKIEKNLPSNVIRLPSAHISTKDLGDMFGKILIEKL